MLFLLLGYDLTLNQPIKLRMNSKIHTKTDDIAISIYRTKINVPNNFETSDFSKFYISMYGNDWEGIIRYHRLTKQRTRND